MKFFFGPYPLYASQIFLETVHSLAIVNLKPIVPGHVLVLSKRNTPRLNDLLLEEYLDLWSTVRLVSPIIESHYGAQSLNVAVQDGDAAGQSVPHVHVHILPRRNGDFNRNDDVYDHLENQALHEVFDASRVDPAAERKPRSVEEMAAETSTLRSLFGQSVKSEDL